MDDKRDTNILNYPGYCLAMTLVFSGALGLSLYLHAV